MAAYGEEESPNICWYGPIHPLLVMMDLGAAADSIKIKPGDFKVENAEPAVNGENGPKIL